MVNLDVSIWMAWNKLSISKSEGGLRFRNVDDFNSALLTK